MIEKEAREILNNPALTENNPMLRNKPFITQGYLEAREKARGLEEELERLVSISSGFAGAKEALARYRETI